MWSYVVPVDSLEGGWTLRGCSVTERVAVRPPEPYAVRVNVCALEQLNGRLVLPFGGRLLPPLVIDTRTALLVFQLAVKFWKLPL